MKAFVNIGEGFNFVTGSEKPVIICFITIRDIELKIEALVELSNIIIFSLLWVHSVDFLE